jgi:uncharacterized protein (DUF433 family)
MRPRADPEIMSGAPCFAGTRVPIQNFIDYLEGGDSIEDFLEGMRSLASSRNAMTCSRETLGKPQIIFHAPVRSQDALATHR